MSSAIGSVIVDLLPPEILTQIAAAVGNPPIFARCCRIFKQISEASFQDLLSSYRSFPNINSIYKALKKNIGATDLVLLSAKELVQLIYMRVIHRTHFFKEGRDILIETKNLYDGAILDADRLDAVISWVRQMNKAHHLIKFFSLFAKTNYHFGKDFPGLILGRRTLIEKANSIRGYLNDSSRRAFLDKIRKLTLKQSDLSFIPPELNRLRGVEDLTFSNTQIKKIPMEIVDLAYLKHLHLDNNQLKAVPKVVFTLTKLVSLDLSQNALKQIPKEIGNLSNLKILILAANRLNYLPPEIGELKHLEKICLWLNEIQLLPKEIGKLISLKNLILTFNPLTSLPDELCLASRLEILHLDYHIQTLPDGFANLISLQNLIIPKHLLQFVPQSMRESSGLNIFICSEGSPNFVPPLDVDQNNLF